MTRRSAVTSPAAGGVLVCWCCFFVSLCSWRRVWAATDTGSGGSIEQAGFIDMEHFSRIVFRHRWPIIIGWLVLFGLGAVFAPRLSDVTQGGGFDTPDSESWRAADILQSAYGRGYRRVIQVVFSHPGWQVSDPRYQRAVEDSLARLQQLPHADGALSYYTTSLPQLVSPDGSTTYALVNFDAREDEIQPFIPEMREIVAAGPLEAHLIGGPAFDYDLERTSESDLIRAESYSLPLILVILMFVFGTLVAAGLPLLLGVASVTITLAALWLLGHEMALSVFARNMVTMVGLGLGVDYSLFIVSRFREELAAGREPREALTASMSSAGRAVVFSAAAVIVGLAMLTLFSFVFMRSLGLGGMIVAAVSLLVAITLLPALLVLLKARINSARVIPARFLQADGSRFWHGWSRLVMRRPVFFLLVCLGAMLALAWPVTGMRAGAPGIADLSPDSDSRLGVELFTQKWSLGDASPIYILFDSNVDWAAWSPDLRAGIRDLDAWLKADPRVARVESIAELPLPAEVPRDPKLIAAFASEQPQTAAIAASLVDFNGGSRSTMVRVITGPGSGTSEAKQLVRDLRAHLPSDSRFADMEVLVGGAPAEAVDFTDKLVGSFPYLVVAVLIITYLVLLLLFRSVLLPLKAILMNLLSVSAAFGLLVLVFQDGWGSSWLGFTPTPGIIPFVPVILFSVLFGLSMDYEVFLLSRIKEVYDETGDNELAVATGLEKTGRIITSAALIMIAVFGAFALTESIVIKEFGVGLASSIFLDATIVRVILVPATMKLLGDWNWWLPGWLDRLLPDFSLKH
ncbi:MAG: MMPL family transporter [Thermoleophilia bacterium]